MRRCYVVDRSFAAVTSTRRVIAQVSPLPTLRFSGCTPRSTPRMSGLLHESLISYTGRGYRFRCPRGRDPAAAIAVTGHGDTGCAREDAPVVGEPPPFVAEATAELPHPEPVLARVLGAYPPHQPAPRMGVDRVEHAL